MKDKELKNSGLVISPIKDEQAYILGAGMVPQIVLEPTSDWTTSLPSNEKQNDRYERYNCTAYGMTNAVEILMYKLLTNGMFAKDEIQWFLDSGLLKKRT